MTGNCHVRFGGGRLETQVKLCAGRLPYFILFADNKRTLWEWRAAVVRVSGGLRLTIHVETAHPRPVAEGLALSRIHRFPNASPPQGTKSLAFRRKFKRQVADLAAGRFGAGRSARLGAGWVNHVRYGDTWGCGGRC